MSFCHLMVITSLWYVVYYKHVIFVNSIFEILLEKSIFWYNQQKSRCRLVSFYGKFAGFLKKRLDGQNCNMLKQKTYCNRCVRETRKGRTAVRGIGQVPRRKKATHGKRRGERIRTIGALITPHEKCRCATILLYKQERKRL